MSETILVEESLPRRRCAVLDSEMSYVESDSGGGDLAIVALHGNPTSSYLWRNVLPPLTDLGRCLAPDLIGMGESGKSGDGAYRFVDHARYLDAWFEAVVTEPRVVLVVHDWGGALGFHWARRHPNRVAGIAYMETIVTPLTWADWPDAAREVFQGMRSPAGEAMVLEKNVFVERILPGSILRKMSDAEMAVYRKPFTEPGESRRPTLTWPRQIPIEGEPADVTEIATASEAWLAASPVPKLFVNAEPGAILTGRQRELCRAWPNQQEVTVKGSHFVQEDSPREIAEAVASFISGLK